MARKATGPAAGAPENDKGGKAEDKAAADPSDKTKGARSRSVRGKRLGRYTLLEHLADGGMAEIFLARRNDEGRGFNKDLVLKVLQDRYANHAQVVAMFLEEARLAAVLRHPNIVDTYDVGEEDGVRFIAMEYIEGRTLTEVIARSLEVGAPLPLGLAVHIIAEVASALAYLQEGIPGRGRAPGIVHRDISPTNIVIGWNGQTKIIDFGIAQRGQGETDTGTRPGKVAYMSPEQVKGEVLDGRSDLFSLGIILYEITLGQRLWRGPAESVMRRIVEESPPPPTYVQRGYPPALERIVLKLLEKRPQDRYASASALLQDLDQFLSGGGMLRGARVLGDFVRSLYAPSAHVVEGGSARAQGFQEDDAVDPAMLAPIDFDRAGSGAALAHALRGAEPFELAAEVTAVAPIPGAAIPDRKSTPASGASPSHTGQTPPPVSPGLAAAAASLRSSALSEIAPMFSPNPPAEIKVAPENDPATLSATPRKGRAGLRTLMFVALLTILLGGIYFVLRSS